MKVIKSNQIKVVNLQKDRLQDYQNDQSQNISIHSKETNQEHLYYLIKGKISQCINNKKREEKITANINN